MIINYFKGEPNNYVIRYKNGQIKEDGKGLDFWYMPFNTSIAVIIRDVAVDGETRSAQGPAFVPVTVKAQFIEILLPGGGLVRLSVGIDRDVLTDVIRVQKAFCISNQLSIPMGSHVFIISVGCMEVTFAIIRSCISLSMASCIGATSGRPMQRRASSGVQSMLIVIFT